MNHTLDVSYNPTTDVLTVECIDYAAEIFRTLGSGPIGPSTPAYRMVGRAGGKVTLQRVEEAQRPPEFSVVLNPHAAELLTGMCTKLDDDDEHPEIALMVGETINDDGTVDYGLHAWDTSCPGEGVVHLVDMERDPGRDDRVGVLLSRLEAESIIRDFGSNVDPIDARRLIAGAEALVLMKNGLRLTATALQAKLVRDQQERSAQKGTA